MWNFFGLVFLIFISPIIAGADTHNANEILITLNSFKMTLQEAIDNKFLVDEIALPMRHYTSSVNPGHTADEIIISINGQVKNLQEAINGATLQNKGLCSSSGNPSNKPVIGHLSTDVKISTSETLQQAINSGKFCDQYTYSWDTSDNGWAGACSQTVCGSGIQTRTVWCKRSNGQTVGDTFCPTITKPLPTDPCTAGESDCGWSGFTQTGTCSKDCGTGTLQRTRTCNIAGHCVGDTDDWNGASCYRDTSCNYQTVTINSRTPDTMDQCNAQKYPYYTKGWWWIKGLGGYVNPCTTRLGSGWEVVPGTNRVNPTINFGYYRGYLCQVDCQKKLPSVSQDFSVSVPKYEQINQCLDHGWKTMWGMSCPSGYTKVEYQLKSIEGFGRITCQTLCVLENTA